VATYKLIQDIEAEDKILGPLTLRQFIFALIAVFFFYLSFICATKGAPFLLVLFLPPGLFLAFFAFPFGRDQPTEIWFLAKLRFWFLPRNRIWDQSGVKELVTITVPKKVERVLTNGLSETEVKSRLQALANTIDSRGWAIKNVNTYTQPVVVGGTDDRLINLSSLPQEVPDEYDAGEANDIMDPFSSPVAQNVDYMVNQSTQAHHQLLMEELNAPIPAPIAPALAPAPSWFMGQGGITSLSAPVLPPQRQTQPYVPPQQALQAASAPLPPISLDEGLLSSQLRHQAGSQQSAYSHLRTLQPLGSQPSVPATQIPIPVSDPPAMTAPSDPAILSLASNDDLDVATLAREAKKARDDKDLSNDEVVISLR
jgi:hypothetical protein